MEWFPQLTGNQLKIKTKFCTQKAVSSQKDKDERKKKKKRNQQGYGSSSVHSGLYGLFYCFYWTLYIESMSVCCESESFSF